MIMKVPGEIPNQISELRFFQDFKHKHFTGQKRKLKGNILQRTVWIFFLF